MSESFWHDRGLITPNENSKMEEEIFKYKALIDNAIIIFLKKDRETCWKNYINGETRRDKQSYDTMVHSVI